MCLQAGPVSEGESTQQISWASTRSGLPVPKQRRPVTHKSVKFVIALSDPLFVREVEVPGPPCALGSVKPTASAGADSPLDGQERNAMFVIERTSFVLKVIRRRFS